MTKHEIIQETYDFYSADPNGKRGYDSAKGACVNETPDGKKCALARCGNELFPYGLTGTVVTVKNYAFQKELFLDDLLEEKYRGHEAGFWGSIQSFHDNHKHWNTVENKITEEGEKYYKELLKTYAAE